MAVDIGLFKLGGIYRIVIDRPDGHKKFYIGQSRYFGVRKKEHLKSLLKGTHYNKPLQRAFDRYGASAVSFEIVLVCSPQRELLSLYEQIILDSYRPQTIYNIKRLCVDSPLGLKQTPETKARKSAALRGMKRTAEEIAKSSLARTGKKRSDETRLRMSLAGRGRKLSEEHRAKVVAALRRAVHGPISAETRIKMRAAARNRRQR
jgi:group I intron endonuclease